MARSSSTLFCDARRIPLSSFRPHHSRPTHSLPNKQLRPRHSGRRRDRTQGLGTWPVASAPAAGPRVTATHRAEAAPSLSSTIDRPVTPLAPRVRSGDVTRTRRTLPGWFGGTRGGGGASRRRALWRRRLLRRGTHRRARNSQMAVRAVLGARFELLTTETARDGGHGEVGLWHGPGSTVQSQAVHLTV
jgi:hypothetical protein